MISIYSYTTTRVHCHHKCIVTIYPLCRPCMHQVNCNWTLLLGTPGASTAWWSMLKKDEQMEEGTILMTHKECQKSSVSSFLLVGKKKVLNAGEGVSTAPMHKMEEYWLFFDCAHLCWPIANISKCFNMLYTHKYDVWKWMIFAYWPKQVSHSWHRQIKFDTGVQSRSKQDTQQC